MRVGESSGRNTRRTSFILSLGSNLGDRRENLKRGLASLARCVSLEAISRVVESAPWGAVPDQPDFLNLVLRGSTHLDALGLLRVAQEAESEAGRVRSVEKGPRTLDVDLIFFGSLQLQGETLTVPHPHWAERPFVYGLIPEVADDMVDPDSGRRLADLRVDELSLNLRTVAPIELDRAAARADRG